jgi:predicted CxxxxCH...CXXCH cytochrome family protein
MYGVGRSWLGNGIRRHSGKVKVSILLSLSAFFFIFLLFSGTRQTQAEDCGCSTCHGTFHGEGWNGCATCHGFPPATGSHLKHFSDTGNILGNYLPYGSTSLARDSYPDPAVPAPSYLTGCGNCHPIDKAMHQNGTVDIELYNAAAPSGSLKAKNVGAGYTPGGTVFNDDNNIPYTHGTCSNVYCHSYSTWTSSGPTAEQGCNSSIPSNLVTAREYRQATWGGSSLTCSGCHNNPPLTSYPSNDAGIGDSHQWIDSSGYGNLHMYNHNKQPAACSYCHNNTTREVNTWSRNSMDVTTMGDVPIHNYSAHVNGFNDVVFDRANPILFQNSFSLSGASYDASSKTCSNISCHFGQTSVSWGESYKYYVNMTGECDRCHQKGYCP